jgi:hypothetical protein
MAEGTTGVRYHTQQTHYVAAVVTSDDTGTTVTVGKLPPGAYIKDAGIIVKTAFAGGTPTIGIGANDDPDGIASAVAVTSAGLKAADELATSNDLSISGENTITATLSASMTSGEGLVFVEFIPVDPAVAAS